MDLAETEKEFLRRKVQWWGCSDDQSHRWAEPGGIERFWQVAQDGCPVCAAARKMRGDDAPRQFMVSVAIPLVNPADSNCSTLSGEDVDEARAALLEMIPALLKIAQSVEWDDPAVARVLAAIAEEANRAKHFQ